MTVIVDANIVISAIIKPESEIAEILLILNNIIEFVLPEYALEEITEHENEICTEYDISPAVFQVRLDKISKGLLIFSSNLLDNDILYRAEQIVRQVDIDDTIYVAFSITLDALYWTGDRKLYRALRRTGFNDVINTAELKQIIKGL